MKKKNFAFLLALILILTMSLGFVLMACDPDADKASVTINADEVQTVEYDGKAHKITVSTNPADAVLVYEPAEAANGYSEVGEYKIKLSVKETDTHKAAEKTVTLKIVDNGKTPVIIKVDGKMVTYDGKLHTIDDYTVKPAEYADEVVITPAEAVKGYREAGTYPITFSIKETAEHKAASETVYLTIAADVSSIWTQFSNRMIDSYDVDLNDDITFNFQASATAGAHTYSLDAKGNVNRTDSEVDRSVFRIVLKDNGALMFGLYYQDGSLFFDDGSGVSKVNGLSLLSVFAPAHPDESNPPANASVSGEDILTYLGIAVAASMNTEDIAINDNVFSFHMDLNAMFSKAREGLLDAVLSDYVVALDAVTAALAVTRPVIDLNVDFSGQTPVFDTAISSTKFDDVTASLSAAEMANGAYAIEDVAALTQTQMDNAVVVDIASAQLKGTFSMANRAEEKYMTYHWKLLVNFNPFVLPAVIQEYASTSNPYGWWNDERILGSKLYFQVWHECNDACQDPASFCATRLHTTNGVKDRITNVLDVAFDPEHFGSGAIYVNVDLGALFSDGQLWNILDMFGAKDAKDFVKALFYNPNQLLPIDIVTMNTPYDTAAPDNGASAQNLAIDAGQIGDILNTVWNVLKKGLIYPGANGGLTLDVRNLFTLLEDYDVDDMLNGLLGDTLSFNQVKDLVSRLLSPDSYDKETMVRGLNVSITQLKLMSKEVANFNAYEEIIHKNPATGGERNWNKTKPVDPVNGNPTATGNIETMSGLKLMTPDTAYIAPAELQSLVGTKLEYSYTDVFGDQQTATTHIVGFRGIDYTNVGKPQTVKVITTPLDGKDGILHGVLGLTGMMGMIGIDANTIKLPLPCSEVSMTLTLKELSNVDLHALVEPEEEYLLDLYSKSESNKIKLNDSSKNVVKGEAVIEYADGSTKKLSMPTPTSTNLLVLTEGSLLKSTNYYLINDGEPKYYTFAYAGYEKVYNLNVSTPVVKYTTDVNGSLEVEYFGKVNGLNAGVSIMDSAGTKALDPATYDITINGIDGKTLKLDALKAGKTILVNKDMIEVTYRNGAPKGSYYIWFEPTTAEGKKAGQAFKYIGATKNEYGDGDQSKGSLGSKAPNVGQYLNGLASYYYQNAENQMVQLSLYYNKADGKYYMTDNAQDFANAEKYEATVSVLNGTQAIVLENGLIPADQLSTTASYTINVEFEYNGKTITYDFGARNKFVSTTPSIATANLPTMGTVSFGENKLFDGYFTLNTYDEDYNLIAYRLTFQDGKYVFVNEVGDTISAKMEVTSGGKAIALVNGMLPDELASATATANKYDIKVSASVNEKEYSVTSKNKAVIASGLSSLKAYYGAPGRFYVGMRVGATATYVNVGEGIDTTIMTLAWDEAQNKYRLTSADGTIEFAVNVLYNGSNTDTTKTVLDENGYITDASAKYLHLVFDEEVLGATNKHISLYVSATEGLYTGAQIQKPEGKLRVGDRIKATTEYYDQETHTFYELSLQWNESKGSYEFTNAEGTFSIEALVFVGNKDLSGDNLLGSDGKVSATAKGKYAYVQVTTIVGDLEKTSSVTEFSTIIDAE